MNHLFLKAFVTILFCFAGNIVCSARAYEPVSQNAFTGAGSFCQGTAADVITFTYNTCSLGGGGNVGDACKISWYTNTTNSTNVGTATLVSGPTNFNSATAATGTQTYTPPTTTAGALYYFCVITRTVAGCDGVTANSTLSSSTALLVTVLATPKSTGVTNSGPICNGSNVTLSANTGTSANGWSWTGSDGSSSAVENPVMTPAATTSYTLIASNTDGCPTPTAYYTTVVVKVVPTSTGATNNGPICNGSTVTLFDNSTNATGWSWTGSDGTSSNVESPTFTPTATTTYSLTVTNSDGCADATVYPTTVVVNVLPTSTGATNSGPVCSGSVVTLFDNSTNATGWSWTGSDGTSSNAQSPTFTPTTTTTYSLTVTNTDGCVNSTVYPTTVAMSAFPTSTGATNSGPVCSGSTVTLFDNSTNATGWSWTGSDGTSSNMESPTFTPTATTTYSLTVTNTDGCVNATVYPTTVIADPLPQVFNVTGGGNYCSAGEGLYIDLDNSDVGVNYQLYYGSTATGAAVPGALSSLSFGPETGAGTYTVMATNASTGCTNGMAGIATINVTPAPTQYTVTGGGQYCIGGAGYDIGLNNSDVGSNYQLYNGATAVGSSQSGTGHPLDFGVQTVAGTYSVLATSTATGCMGGMANTVAIIVNPLPNLYTVGGSGSFCSGGAGIEVTLSNSDIGVNYQLYNGSTATGALVMGTNIAPLDMGMETVAGTYTVFATNATTGCTANMNGSAGVTVNPSPAVYNVLGGGSLCAGGTGVDISLSNSDLGVNYQLYNGATATGAAVAGTNVAPLDMGLQTAAGTYTVLATNASSGCMSNMSGSAGVTVNPLPNVYTLSNGGSYCAGGTGVDLTLSGSDNGINYQLYNGSTASGSPIAGTGDAPPFDLGLQTAGGTYTVLATNPATSCMSNMLGSAGVTVNPLPAIYSVTGGGAYCAGGLGVHVGLNGSDMGVVYQLFNGATLVSTLNGTSAILDFGLQTTAGNYTIIGYNATTLCTNDMNGSVNVSINPAPTQYTVSAGGGYCSGNPGVDITLTGSQSGIDYQLYNGSAPVGSPLSGTGLSPFDMGVQTAGSYTVFATDPTTFCTSGMLGTAVIIENPLPTAYPVMGGGAYCAGGTGIDVSIGGSASGVDYQLYNGATLVNTISGNGLAIDFGLQTAAGTYTVLATNTTTFCANDMSGSATVSVNPLPNVYSVAGGGAFCAGDAGEEITLSNSDIGVNYQLYNGSAATGSPVPGTAVAPLDMGMEMSSGTYTVLATNATTGCTNNMTGSASVTMNPLPTVYAVTGGGSYCAGGTGEDVGLIKSDLGVSYQLYADTDPIGGAVAGTGNLLDFGFFTAAGSYVVVATNNTTGCQDLMSDSATIIINPLPGPIDGATSICLNTSTTLTDGSSGGAWSSNDASIATIDPSLGLMTGVASGMTTITYTLPTTCAITTAVTVNALPVVAVITGVTNECAGMGNTLADATASGIWSSSNTAIATIDPVLGTVNGLMAGIVTMSYTVTNGSGCVTSVVTADTVNALPVVDAISGAMNVCVNSMVTLADDSAGGVWASSNITIGTIDPSGNVTGIAAGNTTITYTVTNAAGCITYVTAIEAVDPLPMVAAITGMTSACAGAGISLSDVTPGGVWSSSNTGVATVDGAGMVTGIAAGNASISYMVTSVHGCVTTVMYNVVIGTPIPASSVAPTGNVTLCNATPINLVLTTAGSGLTYQWLEDGNDIAGATNGSYITDTTGLFTVILNSGVCSDTLTGTTVLPPPNPVINYNSSGDYLYTGTFATYQWFKNGTPITGANSSILILTGAGTYKVVVSDADGCYVTSASYEITSGGGGGPTGVNNSPTAASVKIYPNPATSILQIDAPVIVNVSVISPDGKLVIAQKQATSIDVSQLADGLYIIMIYDENNALLSTDKFAKTN